MAGLAIWSASFNRKRDGSPYRPNSPEIVASQRIAEANEPSRRSFGRDGQGLDRKTLVRHRTRHSLSVELELSKRRSRSRRGDQQPASPARQKPPTIEVAGERRLTDQSITCGLRRRRSDQSSESAARRQEPTSFDGRRKFGRRRPPTQGQLPVRCSGLLCGVSLLGTLATVHPLP